jgi:hypothetical protein
MSKLHPVFHVSLLEPFIETSIDNREVVGQQPIELQDDNQFEVEQVINARIQDNVLQFLLQWKGYGIEDRSWEPFEEISCRRLISEFYVNNSDAVGRMIFISRYPDNHGLTELDPKGGGTVKISPRIFTQMTSQGAAGRSKAQ